jgi:hypothetical protein
MLKIKCLFSFILFLTTITLCQAMQDSTNVLDPEGTKWPILAKLKAMKSPELDQRYSDLTDQTDTTPLPRVQEETARFSFIAEGSYVEFMFESLRLAQQPKTEETERETNDLKIALDFYHQGFREDYYKRFPDEVQTNFDAIMNPFQSYINSLSTVIWYDLKEEEANDIFEKAWGLLKQALKTEL